MPRFGSADYTIRDIEDIAKRHGRDGIYYPPHRWGLDDDEPNGTTAFSALYRLAHTIGEEQHQSTKGN